MAAAQKLTNLIKQIIEFAKMVPGFMKLNQDDQIVLLKKGKKFLLLLIKFNNLSRLIFMSIFQNYEKRQQKRWYPGSVRG